MAVSTSLNRHCRYRSITIIRIDKVCFLVLLLVQKCQNTCRACPRTQPGKGLKDFDSFFRKTTSKHLQICFYSRAVSTSSTAHYRNWSGGFGSTAHQPDNTETQKK
ncbi:MAG: hypothetical protein H3C41_10815 [Bacteroidales bacterium]|nr:hypothetical protein [Bacteroidales bacterium]